MISKVKIITLSVIGILLLISCIGVSVYIKHLNKRIDSLNSRVVAQESEINNLSCQLESLENSMESFRSTLNTTSDYINKLKEIQHSDIETKSLIYKEVISDEVTKEWYDRRLPDNIINIINGAHDGMCKD